MIKKRATIYFIGGLAGFILVFILGIYTATFLPICKITGDKAKTILEEPVSSQGGLVHYKTAQIIGDVENVQGYELTVRADNGEKQKFTLTDNIAIYKPTAPGETAKPTNNISEIKAGDKVSLTLSTVDSKAIVTIISIFPR